MSRIVETHDLTRRFPVGRDEVTALAGVSVCLEEGEFTAIMGPSGSGKSTFMNLVGCLDRPSGGTYLLDGVDVSKLTPRERAEVRRTKLGFVFQQYNLLARTSSVENVELPLVYAPVSAGERRRRALQALSDVGLDERHYASLPNELSGGQQQRVAIARALINRPRLVLADEPTGALDSKTSRDIMELFLRLNDDRGVTILMVTHEPDVARYAQRIVSFLDGRVVGDQPVRDRARAVAT